MASDNSDLFLFLGSTDSESATTRLRAGGALYRKKLLNSRPENWRDIVEVEPSSASVVALRWVEEPDRPQ